MGRLFLFVLLLPSLRPTALLSQFAHLQWRPVVTSPTPTLILYLCKLECPGDPSYSRRRIELQYQ